MRSLGDCFSHKQLSPVSKLVYLFFRYKTNDIIAMTLPQIANELCLGKDCVFRALKPLKEYGFIDVEQHGRTPSCYHLL